MMEGRRAALQ